MKKQLEKYLSYAKQKKAKAIELFYAESQDDTVSVRNQEIEQIQSACDKGLSVRVIKDQHFGFSYTTSLTPEDIKKTIDAAIENTQHTAVDNYLALPKPKTNRKKIQLKDFDKSILTLTPSERLDYALKTEQAAYDHDKRVAKTESAGFSTSITKTTLVNSYGVSISQQKTSCGVSVEIIAEENGQMEAAYDYQYTARLKRLDPKTVGTAAGQKAVSMLGAGGITTGQYDLLLTPKVAINFLSVILPMFSADNIQKNKSLLKNKLNKTIASPLITLVDDPFLIEGLGSGLYDGEGVPTQQKMLIKNGILNSYLYDTYTANKGKTKSTGNSARGSIKTEPTISVCNLYLNPGSGTQEDLIKMIKKGVLIQTVMGLHTADPISGEYSLGATGHIIENGRLVSAVKDMAIAGNLIDLMKSIYSLGGDLTFSGSLGSPSIIVKNITVAGNN